MEAAIIGLIGVVFGIFLSEFLRRKSRIELYSNAVFEKRLKAYEDLYKLIHESQDIAYELINNPEYTIEEFKTIWPSVILKLTNYCDENALYLNEEIQVHCITSLIGLEEISEKLDQDDKEKLIESFGNKTGNAKLMIKQEIGIPEIEKLYRKISKSKPQSDIIKYYQSLKKRKK